MYIDVVDLKAFYRDRLGRIVARIIASRIDKIWPNQKGQSILGVGFATTILAKLGKTAERKIAFMPAKQGVVRWPTHGANGAALVHDDTWPLPGGSIDRIVIVHSLEHTDDAHELLREAWRVLAPAGRLLVVVPNRVGLWARSERTPFGHGRPFTRGQLTRLLRDTMFSTTNWFPALAMPPTRFLVHTGANWERIGTRLWPRMSGLLMVEATKLVQQRVEVKAQRARVRRVISPALAPTAGVRTRTSL